MEGFQNKSEIKMKIVMANMEEKKNHSEHHSIGEPGALCLASLPQSYII